MSSNFTWKTFFIQSDKIYRYKEEAFRSTPQQINAYKTVGLGLGSLIMAFRVCIKE